MAIISTLRDKMGKFLVVVVGFSIAAFVLGDILGPNSSIGGQNRNIVGKINGEDIDLILFTSVYEQLAYNFSLNQGRSPNNVEISNLRDQAWEKLINDISYMNQYEKLGLQVTDRESVDMVQGNNIHPMIVEAFTDPSTGYFNVDNVIGYLQNLSNQPSGQQQAWYSFESNLRPMRMRSKYDNLIGLSTHINSLQAQNEYFSTSKTIDLSYFFVPFYKVPDSLFDVSSKEMRSYLKKNKEDYKQVESRSIDYAFFPLLPSKEDSLYFEDEIKNIISRLLSGDINDSTFALLNSDGFSPYVKYNIDQIPEQLNNKNIGYVSDYKFENGSLIVYKLSDIVEDQNFKARAKHILLKFDDSNKSAVRSEAQRILSLVKTGSDFDETARTYSQDVGSASNGGDLNWFTEGMMVKPFEDAVFSRKRAGLIPRIIESEFGYHIIYVTQPKTKSSYVVTTISKEILPSDNTRNNIYRAAEMFKIESKASNKSFTEYADENNKSIDSENNLDNKASSFGNLENARSVVIWTYDDTRDINDLSEVIELDDGYVVAHVSDIKEEGTKNIDEVENSIRKKIIDDKKFNYLSKLLTGYESLDELKEIYENGDIYSMPDLTFNSNSLLNVGYSPEAVGVAFSMNENELTKPFKIDDGIIIIQLNNILDADTLSSYDDYGISLLQANKFTAPIKIDNSIKMFSDIEDYRYKFF
tara:strand:+ start:3889 stop:5982 length:2094 start_codon:yes stop_codon:yes gene_type:complete